MNLSSDVFAAVYLMASILFIFGLKGLAHPKTALRGNTMAMVGMGLAIGITLLHPSVTHYTWIISGVLAGALVGTIVARKIQMTSMPELVAALHSFVGLSAVLVAIGTFLTYQASGDLNAVLLVELVLGSAIGAITFTGSIVAFGKLKGSFGSNPIIFKGRHLVNIGLGIAVVLLTINFIGSQSLSTLIVVTLIAFLLGVLLVVPIGGADMPVVVSMLNSYSGWAAAATGFTLNNYLLIATGAVVGSSGAILSYIMCKAMNRSFISVILGGFGGEGGAGACSTQIGKTAKSAAPEDVSFMLENASKVIVIPGYGMAVAQAQHAVKELADQLIGRDVEVKFAIHPVAGRMPGHMNVLLAEADIDYDIVEEMEAINGEFSTTDVALVIGANDVINPAAKTDKSSPLYGMPILDAYKSKQVFVCKRSLKPGYAGVENELFFYENCSLVFGDAKSTLESIVRSLS